MIFNKGIVVEHNNMQHPTNIGCAICFTGLAGPMNHAGSPFCEEGSIASGGRWSHCQCDTCKSADGLI
jgi:hypothetical protein